MLKTVIILMTATEKVMDVVNALFKIGSQIKMKVDDSLYYIC